MSGGEASHYRGRSWLYKSAKAGCSGHSLPTVTRVSRADTRPRLWSAQRQRGWGDWGPRTWEPRCCSSPGISSWSRCDPGSRFFPPGRGKSVQSPSPKIIMMYLLVLLVPCCVVNYETFALSWLLAKIWYLLVKIGCTLTSLHVLL